MKMQKNNLSEKRREQFLEKKDKERNYFEPGDYNPKRPTEKSEDMPYCISCGSYYEMPSDNEPKWKGWHNHCKQCQL